MADDKKQVREVANCIRVLLKSEGVNTTIKDVVKVIEDEDLTNPVALKDKIKNDMRTKQDEVENKPNRRDHIKTFVVENYGLIKDNPIVLDALVKSYCQGRLKKEQREEMAAELLDACKGQTQADTTTDTETEAEAETSGYDF